MKLTTADGKNAVCPYCGNEYHFKEEKSEALTITLNRANDLRMRNDFDGAIAEYKLITQQNPTDAEAFWGLALSTYGIEYVEDPRTGKRIPTCRRTVKKSILEDENYLTAIKNAAEEQREIYENRAWVIDRLQRNIKRQLEDEEDYDVFISFKSTDTNGNPTKERTIARHIYDELKKRGIKTFFSEVTLRNRIGEDFEPIIFKALYSCKFFILVATSEENVNAVWVKNEWSRFRDRITDENLTGSACAVFENISPNTLPAFLRTQGINLAKYPAGGYEIELADAISLKLGLTQKNDEAEEIRRQIEESQRQMEEQRKQQQALEERLKTIISTTAAPISQGAVATTQTLLIRAKQEAEDGNFDKATDYYNKVLDAAPANSEAWFGLFLCENNISNENEINISDTSTNIEECEKLFAQNDRIAHLFENKKFEKAVRFADSDTKIRLEKFQKDTLVKVVAALNNLNNEKKQYVYEKEQIKLNEAKKAGFVIEGKCLIGYTGLDTNIVIPDFIQTIGEDVFRMLPKTIRKETINIKIPASVSVIETFAFSNFNIESIIFEPGSCLRKIASYAFCGCGISSIQLPENLKFIGDNAFASSRLTSITIPAKVEHLGNGAFQGSHIESFSIAAPIPEFGNDILKDCTSLTYVRMPREMKKLENNLGIHKTSNLGKLFNRLLGDTSEPITVTYDYF